MLGGLVVRLMVWGFGLCLFQLGCRRRNRCFFALVQLLFLLLNRRRSSCVVGSRLFLVSLGGLRHDVVCVALELTGLNLVHRDAPAIDDEVLDHIGHIADQVLQGLPRNVVIALPVNEHLVLVCVCPSGVSLPGATDLGQSFYLVVALISFLTLFLLGHAARIGVVLLVYDHPIFALQFLRKLLLAVFN